MLWVLWANSTQKCVTGQMLSLQIEYIYKQSTDNHNDTHIDVPLFRLTQLPLVALTGWKVKLSQTQSSKGTSVKQIMELYQVSVLLSLQAEDGIIANFFFSSFSYQSLFNITSFFGLFYFSTGGKVLIETINSAHMFCLWCLLCHYLCTIKRTGVRPR